MRLSSLHLLAGAAADELRLERTDLGTWRQRALGHAARRFLLPDRLARRQTACHLRAITFCDGKGGFRNPHLLAELTPAEGTARVNQLRRNWEIVHGMQHRGDHVRAWI